VAGAIDLGELPKDEPPGQHPPARPWRFRLRTAGVVAAALATLTLGAAARPGPEPHFTVYATGVAADRHTLYSFDDSGPYHTLTAYRLVDGSVAWQTVFRDERPPETTLAALSDSGHDAAGLAVPVGRCVTAGRHAVCAGSYIALAFGCPAARGTQICGSEAVGVRADVWRPAD
jgi:hypothetical protein